MNNGVRPLGIVLATPSRPRTIMADAVTSIGGVHALEPDDDTWWTNGDATLPSDLFILIDGPFRLTLHSGGAAEYIEEGPRARVA